MSYRTAAEMIDLAKQSREIASAINKAEWEHKRLQVARLVPVLLEKVLLKIRIASEAGEYWVDYKPPFWDVRYWFTWDHALRSLLMEELQSRNFECVIHHRSRPVINIYWGKSNT